MPTHRLPSLPRRALTGIAVVAAAVALVAAPAGAAPAAPPPANPLQQYQQLSQQASDLNNDLQTAQYDLTTKNGQLTTANADLVKAQQAETAAQAQQQKVQGQVDEMMAATYEGAQYGQMSALFTGTSTRDYLDRATALSDLAEDNKAALAALSTAVKADAAARDQAQTAQRHAQAATTAAAALVSHIQQQQTALTTRIAQVKAAADKLSAAEQQTVHDVGPPVKPAPTTKPGGSSGGGVGPVAGGGVRIAALNAALGKRGSAYAWGAAGPGTFDCSGLVLWSYKQQGVSLPHSSQAQSGMGTLISSRSALQPGDLVFFGSSTSIHHVGIYVGNGQMVDAPDTGSVVRIDNLFSDYAWGRRLG